MLAWKQSLKLHSFVVSRPAKIFIINPFSLAHNDAKQFKPQNVKDKKRGWDPLSAKTEKVNTKSVYDKKLTKDSIKYTPPQAPPRNILYVLLLTKQSIPKSLRLISCRQFRGG